MGFRKVPAVYASDWKQSWIAPLTWLLLLSLSWQLRGAGLGLHCLFLNTPNELGQAAIVCQRQQDAHKKRRAFVVTCFGTCPCAGSLLWAEPLPPLTTFNFLKLHKKWRALCGLLFQLVCVWYNLPGYITYSSVYYLIFPLPCSLLRQSPFLCFHALVMLAGRELQFHLPSSLFACVNMTMYRPVGSKFEMVRSYYSTKHVHNVLGHAHLPPLTHHPFARVSWPNIGPAATEPARPAPTALMYMMSVYMCKLPMPIELWWIYTWMHTKTNWLQVAIVSLALRHMAKNTYQGFDRLLMPWVN